MLRIGTRSDSHKVEAIADSRPAAVAGPPSYLLHLTEVAAAVGIDLSTCGVRTVLSGLEEPGVAVDGSRRLLVERFGARGVLDGYGRLALFPLARNCPSPPTST